MNDRASGARDFELETHRIDQLIWDSIALRAGESVLFCGFANALDWIVRAVEIGANVSVITPDDAAIREHAGLDVAVLKGSTTLIPARDASFDAAVAFHYLHEVDPFFHANVVSELARVGKRLVIVEPAPPSDPLGLRIASLYSRAKRELGQFEYYQQIDYWKKLLSIVKADVTQETYAFTRVPPRNAIKDTVAFILDTMAAEETPEPYLEELRALAKRPDAQLVPQARYVLVGAAVGGIPTSSAGTRFRSAPLPAEAPREPARPPAPTVYEAPSVPEMPPVIPAAAEPAFGFGSPDVAPPRPPGLPPAGVAPPAAPFAAPGEPGFGLPAGEADPLPRSGFGWEWEPPDSEEPRPEPKP
ncbi:MAG: class I SAM-dependent methyltransferase [Candidatus Velthaea sp.]